MWSIWKEKNNCLFWQKVYFYILKKNVQKYNTNNKMSSWKGDDNDKV
jgi:hypothetical protein